MDKNNKIKSLNESASRSGLTLWAPISTEPPPFIPTWKAGEIMPITRLRGYGATAVSDGQTSTGGRYRTRQGVGWHGFCAHDCSARHELSIVRFIFLFRNSLRRPKVLVYIFIYLKTSKCHETLFSVFSDTCLHLSLFFRLYFFSCSFCFRVLFFLLQISFMLGRDLAKRGFEEDAWDYLTRAAAPWNRQVTTRF